MEDLKADSANVMVLIMDLEDTFNLTVDDSAIATLRTVGDVVSTVGAGDNFNAGFSCALVWQGITREALPHLSRQEWEPLIQTACDFAAEACRSTDNYISKEWGERVRR